MVRREAFFEVYTDSLFAGFGTLVAALLLAGSALFVYGKEPFLFVTDHWIGLSTGALLMAIFQVRQLHVADLTSSDDLYRQSTATPCHSYLA
jgi:hypothetical protein